jgi:hypothetical protein
MGLEAYEQYRSAYEEAVENPNTHWRIREACRLMLAKLDQRENRLTPPDRLQRDTPLPPPQSLSDRP